jgi:hypothetical protein
VSQSTYSAFHNQIARITRTFRDGKWRALDTMSVRAVLGAVQVSEKERELARAWERKHGRAPTSRELLYIANAATLQSRKGKEPGAIDWDALARRWDATLGGALAGIAPAVSDVRGPGAEPGEHHVGRRRASPSRRHPSWPPSLPRSTSLSWPPDI